MGNHLRKRPKKGDVVKSKPCKMKKHERILRELKYRRELNNNFCMQNSITPSEYMEGSNRVLDEMIKYIENLK